MAKTTPLAGDALVEWFEASRAISQPCRDAGAVLADWGFAGDEIAELQRIGAL